MKAIKNDEKKVKEMIEYYLNNKISKIDCLKKFNMHNRAGISSIRQHKRFDFSEDFKKNVVDFYLSNSFSVLKTRNNFKMSTSCIKKILKEKDVKEKFIYNNMMQDDDIIEAIRMRRLGKSVYMISDKLNFSVKAISKSLKKNGEMGAPLRCRIINDPAKIIEEYKNTGIIGKDLIKKHNISASSMRKIFNKNGYSFSGVKTFKELHAPKIKKVVDVTKIIKTKSKVKAKPIARTENLNKVIAPPKRGKVFENKKQLDGYMCRIDSKTQIWVTDGSTPEVARERYLAKHNTIDRLNINPMNRSKKGRKSNLERDLIADLDNYNY